jgi:large subunit ribosomal protein L22
MNSQARLRYLRIAPRKVRLLADLVRGKPVGQALAILKYTPKAASKPMEKLLKSAIANAEDLSKGQVDVDKLFVSLVHVDQGPTLRRFMTRAQGRATRVNKKTSHVTLVLADRK